MAKKKHKRSMVSRATNSGGNGSGGGAAGPTGSRWTGRYIVLMRENSRDSARLLHRDAGLQVARSADFEGQIRSAGLANGEAMMFDKVNAALVDSDPDRLAALQASPAVESVEPERVVQALNANPVPPEYVRGYRDAVNELADRLIGDSATNSLRALMPTAPGESQVTWGLQATRALKSRYTGAGIRVAVLDTGIELQHPDFQGRVLRSQSFITGEHAQDGNGHGTHCIGTVSGPLNPSRLPRYGVAPDVEIFAGKVLSNAGFGGDGSILAGIDWAVRNQCAIISMSLGAPVDPGSPPSAQFETIARRVLGAGTIIIAAAGNDSERPGVIRPVSHPANCPSIIAVAAVDSRLALGTFSNGGLNGNGGEVNIAGPGVAVASTWLRPTLYRAISGTSMATPHVAGIAALFAEANPGLRGRELQKILLAGAQPMTGLAARDVGVGLVQAP
jgi:subtilisin family serine protease